MNVPKAGEAAEEQKVIALMGNVDRLVAERRDAEAARVLGEAERILPDHPLVLHERARRLLASGDATTARTILERVVALAPNVLTFWLSLSAALRVLAKREEELQALERALALDATHLVVLLQKGALLDLMNKPRSASAVYNHALQTLARDTPLPPAVQAHVRHAERRVRENADVLAAAIDARLGRLRQDAHGVAASSRFDRCLDQVLGRRRIYMPEPSSMLFPYLRNHEFFDRDMFPWLEALEASTDGIRQELLGVLGADQHEIKPYIEFDEGLPLRQWRDLNHSRRWSAYFLWNQGRREEPHLARCPLTAKALSAVPQVDIPARAPTAFFSILDAHTTIPAHSGVTNTRLTVHLPLIVPGHCRFRVGGETREWREGSAWVFDDTIEHEAWNDSDAPRAILIFDVWNPELTQLERDLVRETTAILADYYTVEGEVPGVVI